MPKPNNTSETVSRAESAQASCSEITSAPKRQMISLGAMEPKLTEQLKGRASHSDLEFLDRLGSAISLLYIKGIITHQQSDMARRKLLKRIQQTVASSPNVPVQQQACSPADLCKCSCCGYQWQRGRDGSHSCYESLHKLIAAMLPVLRQRIDALPAECEYSQELRGIRETAEMVAWRYASQANA